MTVNNQIVVGTLMNLSDNPTRVSIGQDWRESDITHRVPVIVTGNDFSKIYAPLIRDGRMEKFYWYAVSFDLKFSLQQFVWNFILYGFSKWPICWFIYFGSSNWFKQFSWTGSQLLKIYWILFIECTRKMA